MFTPYLSDLQYVNLVISGGGRTCVSLLTIIHFSFLYFHLAENRLNGAEVYVGTFKPEDPSDVSGMTQCGVLQSDPGLAVFQVDCKPVTKGRYLLVRYSDKSKHFLTICEAEAFSKIGECICIFVFRHLFCHIMAKS